MRLFAFQTRALKALNEHFEPQADFLTHLQRLGNRFVEMFRYFAPALSWQVCCCLTQCISPIHGIGANQAQDRFFDNLRCAEQLSIILKTPIPCPDCGESMLAANVAASAFELKQRKVFQLIETESLHIAENESCLAIVCTASL